jgi:hypothetical protein
MRTRILSIIVVLTIALAALGLGAWWVLPNPPGSGSSVPKADGPTLDQALSAANRSLDGLAGGPWALFSIYGVAAQAPFSPNVLSYPSQNRTVNACQAQLNGLTLWNGTMPIFDGTPDSGTAPFWQFGYYSNESQELLLVTSVLGTVHAFSPMALNGSCSPWYDIGNPENWVEALSEPIPDSPGVAQSALEAINLQVSANWLDQNSPIVEIYTSGPGVFDGLGDLRGAVGVVFDRCGLVDVTGIQPSLQWTESLGGTNGSLFNASTNCAMLSHPYFAGYGSYELVYNSSGTSTFSMTAQYRTPFQVSMRFHTGGVPINYDGWGLANWMTNWTLNTSSGTKLPMGAVGCGGWVPSISDCLANQSGWYVVVLSASGEWVNSYGALPGGGAGWSESVTAIVSNQQLVVVMPSSWPGAGDLVNVTSTVSTSAVLGSTTL